MSSLKSDSPIRADPRHHSRRADDFTLSVAKRAILMICLTLLVVTLCIAPADAQQESSPAAHQQFVFAYRLLQRGENEQAAEAFDEFLGKFPRDAKRDDAAYYRAVLARRAGETQRAAALIETVKATTLAPDHAVALLKGQLLSEVGRHREALEALEPMDASNLSSDLAASVLRLRGAAYRQLGNLDAAAAQLRQAVALDTPARFAAMLELGRTLATQDKLAAALETLAPAIASDDDVVASQAGKLAGDLSYQAEQYGQAAEYYYTVMQRWQTSQAFGPSVVGAMWSRFSERRYGEVVNTFEALKGNLSQRDDRIEAWYLAGSALAELGRHSDAAARFNELLEAGVTGQQREKTLFRLARSLFESNRYDEMRRTIAQLIREYPQSQFQQDVAFFQAAALGREGDAARAVAALAPIIDAGPTHPYHGQALLQRASLRDQIGQLDPAINDVQRYLALQSDQHFTPAAQQATLRLIDMLHRHGQFEDAARYAAALAGVPTPGGEEQIESGIEGIAPEVEQEALYRLSLARVRIGEYGPALEALERLLAKYPRNAFLEQAWYYRGLLKMTRGDKDAAVADLLAAADAQTLDQPLRVNALRLAAVRLRERGDDDRAATTLESLTSLVGQVGLSADERLWLGQYELGRGRPEQAMVYAASVANERGTASGSATPAQRGEALLLLGSGRRSMGQLTEAREAFERMIAQGLGDGVRARLELARTYAAAGDDERALAEYAGLTSATSSMIAASALYETAMIHRALGDKPAATPPEQQEQWGLARALLKRLVVLYPDPALSPLPEKGLIALAQLAERQSDMAAAIGHAEELTRLFPESPLAIYAKACAFQWRGKLGEAVFWLEKARESDAPQLRAIRPQITARLEAINAGGGGEAAATGGAP